jgi:hypothetical protein
VNYCGLGNLSTRQAVRMVGWVALAATPVVMATSDQEPAPHSLGAQAPSAAPSTPRHAHCLYSLQAQAGCACVCDSLLSAIPRLPTFIGRYLDTAEAANKVGRRRGPHEPRRHTTPQHVSQTHIMAHPREHSPTRDEILFKHRGHCTDAHWATPRRRDAFTQCSVMPRRLCVCETGPKSE